MFTKTKIIVALLMLGSVIYCSAEKKRQHFVAAVTSILLSENNQPANTETNSSTVVYGSGTETSTGSAVNSGTNPPIGTVTPVVTVEETNSNNLEFNYQSHREITINAVVVDQNRNPIPGALVDVWNGNSSSLLFSQLSSNPTGKVEGSIRVLTTEEFLQINVTYNGVQSLTLQIPIVRIVEGETVLVIQISSISVPAEVSGDTPVVADRDNDGVPDSHDAYPDDPTKASVYRFPSEGGVNTVAYEDLYPVPGDADLNDYVVRFFNEEDVHANGKIVEIRGNYQHVARGAGYKHVLKLKLPDAVQIARAEIRIFDGNGNDTGEGAVYENPGNTISIYNGQDSSKTLAGSNVYMDKAYVKGKISKVRILLKEPVSRSILKNSPYDLYVTVPNTGKDIHFPGYYTGNQFGAGKDDYVDPATGFPWAIMIPGDFYWPLERISILTTNAYPDFANWANTRGVQNKYWYKNYTSTKVYTLGLPSDENLLSF